MKVWIRTRIADTRCGRCNTRYPKGTPMLVLAGGTPLGVSRGERSIWWTLFRCVNCADEPAPANVAALPDELPLRPGARPRASRPISRDDKQRQLGDDQ